VTVAVQDQRHELTTALVPVGTTARKIDHAPSDVEHALATGRYQSPLRYPGAKGSLSRVIGELMIAAQRSDHMRRIDLLVEPFAGGASTTLRLLGAGTVERAVLADADPMVAAFWQVAASRTQDLIDRITDEHARYVAPGGDVPGASGLRVRVYRGPQETSSSLPSACSSTGRPFRESCMVRLAQLAVARRPPSTASDAAST
jgi:hypothetical protein